MFSAAISYASTNTWTTVPHTNTNQPINVSLTNQVKLDGITLGPPPIANAPSLAVFGNTQIDGQASPGVVGVNATFQNGYFYVSGKTGVGVVSPTVQLDVDGNMRLRSGSGTGPYLCARTNGLMIRNGPLGTCY